jgi:signal transduction histidine kinase
MAHKASEKMADGDLSYKVDTSKMFFDFRKHGENLNKISEGMSKAVDERIKSEHFKTELITNVSHDIKTPLTSIINYVDLLGKEELNNEKATEYLEVLERQSSKLKKLIEDLVEASKASSGNLSVNNEKLEAGVFITQTVGEFEEKLSAAGLELIINKPEEPVYILADGRHLWRVMDNLMNNICKYAQPMSRVYVNLEADTKVHITFRNISKYPLNLSGEELMERFVRGDKSRNTEGHGLGLSITQSLIKLMNGEMDITVDGDLFKVILTFNRQMILSDEDENKIS